ncbi:hypothetical protein MSG28_008219 [Choristoneura fumiferana]|uniref:Uncharacterized protein n=1 Tax=Choristoneura fumiferana TaxID=7141 RepID=A0ACC0JAM0_CHOFU|nr:hypothetical protein MSG28_008219 [Choristoneura fumiferana]
MFRYNLSQLIANERQQCFAVKKVVMLRKRHYGKEQKNTKLVEKNIKLIKMQARQEVLELSLRTAYAKCFEVEYSTTTRDNTLEFLPTKFGKLSAIYQGHTFRQTQSKTRWYCSKKSRGGCKATLLTTEDREFVKLENEHYHPPPLLYKTATGQIVRI